MRVAALYDVHGMAFALDAVLAAVETERIDVVVFGGDLVAGPLPRETLDVARGMAGARFVRGNAERLIDGWVAERLSPEEVDELRAWPEQVALDGVLYCHATPRSDEEIVTDVTTDEKLGEILEGVDARLVVGGHTHMQQRRGRYVNAGSVGMPYEGEVAAFWTVVDDGEPSLRKTHYDVEQAIAAVAASGWPGAAEFVEENLRRAIPRAEAIAVFGG
jgi:predicted phosphodiesterase